MVTPSGVPGGKSRARLEALPNAPVAVALRQLLPSPGHTRLLRACLDASNGAGAWSAWRATHSLQETLTHDQVGVKGMLPLLAYALEQNGSTVAADDLRLLRMARYRETLRGERYQAILQETLGALQAGGLKTLLLKGAALAHTVYPQPALRHCHDIDLLIAPADLPRATELLLAQGFRLPTEHTPPTPAPARDDLRLDHASSLPVELHTRLFRNDLFTVPLGEAWQSARAWGDENSFTQLAPEWELVHILGAVICAPGRARVTWVCDAHFLIMANPAMDWTKVCEIAGQSGLTLVVYALLAYLQEQHQSPVPSFVFEHLQGFGGGTSRAGLETILQSARRQRAASYGDLLRAASTWQELAWVVRWMLLPLPTATQRQAMTGWQLPLFYLRRTLRYLARQRMFAKPSKGQA